MYPLENTYKPQFRRFKANLVQRAESLESRESVEKAESLKQAARREWRIKAANALEAAGMIRDANEFRACGEDYLVNVCSSHYDHAPRATPMTCHKPGCPECSARESARKLSRYVPAIHDIMALDVPKGWTLKKFELTTPFRLDSHNAIDNYKKAWQWADKHLRAVVFQVLREMKLLSPGELRRGRADMKRHKIGAVIASEFGERGHKLHFHCLFFGPYIKKDLLTEVWREVTGGECEITWIRVVPADKVDDQVREVVKYITKFQSLPPRLVPQLFSVLKGSRRFRSYGLLHGLKAAEKVPCLCEQCGSARQRVGMLEYLSVCESVGLPIDGDVLRIYEDSRVAPELDLKPGNNSGEASATGTKHEPKMFIGDWLPPPEDDPDRLERQWLYPPGNGWRHTAGGRLS